MTIVDTRRDLDLVREVLDRTDAVLATTDSVLARAEHAATRAHERADHAIAVAHEAASHARRWVPIALVGVTVAVGLGAFVAWRMSSRRHAQQEAFDASI